MGDHPPFVVVGVGVGVVKFYFLRLLLSLAVNLQPPSMYVCVCEWGLAFGAYEGWAVFSFTSVDMYSPRHLQRVHPDP